MGKRFPQGRLPPPCASSLVPKDASQAEFPAALQKQQMELEVSRARLEAQKLSDKSMVLDLTLNGIKELLGRDKIPQWMRESSAALKQFLADREEEPNDDGNGGGKRRGVGKSNGIERRQGPQGRGQKVVRGLLRMRGGPQLDGMSCGGPHRPEGVRYTAPGYQGEVQAQPQPRGRPGIPNHDPIPRGILEEVPRPGDEC